MTCANKLGFIFGKCKKRVLKDSFCGFERLD
jgi:hypothetical protein